MSRALFSSCETIALYRYGRRYIMLKSDIIHIKRMDIGKGSRGVWVYTRENSDSPILEYYQWASVKEMVEACGLVQINRKEAVKSDMRIWFQHQYRAKPRLKYKSLAGTDSTPCLIDCIGESYVGYAYMPNIINRKMWSYLPLGTELKTGS